MAETDDLSKILFDDSSGTDQRLDALERLMERPEDRTFETLLRAMLHEDRPVRRRAAQLFGELIQSLLGSASGKDIEFAETCFELLNSAGYYLIAASAHLARKSSDPARGEAALAHAVETVGRLKKLLRPNVADGSRRVSVSARLTPPGLTSSETQTETGRTEVGIVPTSRRAETPAATLPAATSPVALPDPESLRGPATVFLVRPPTIPIPEVGRIVAEACGAPALDVRNSLFQTRIIVRRDVPPDVVPRLLRKLKEAGQDAVAVEWKDCLLPPKADKALLFSLTDDGFEADVQRPDKTEKRRATWDAVFLVCGVRLFRQTTKTVKVQRSRFFRRVTADQTVASTEEMFLLDVILSDPWDRIRIGEPLPDLSAMGIGIVGGPSEVDARFVARDLISRRVPVRMNEGVRLLGSTGADLEPVTFSGKQHIEHYEAGIIQLARFGLLDGGS